MDYAKEIKKLRQKMLLTQVEFAAFLGVSFESVNRWENAKNEPTMKIKRQLAKLFSKNNIMEEKK
jgi:DNA-binding XRE family transcriptional regulator